MPSICFCSCWGFCASIAASAKIARGWQGQSVPIQKRTQQLLTQIILRHVQWHIMTPNHPSQTSRTGVRSGPNASLAHHSFCHLSAARGTPCSSLGDWVSSGCQFAGMPASGLVPSASNRETQTVNLLVSSCLNMI